MLTVRVGSKNQALIRDAIAYLGNNIDPWSISSQLFAWLKTTLASSSYDKQEQFAGWKMERGNYSPDWIGRTFKSFVLYCGVYLS